MHAIARFRCLGFVAAMACGLASAAGIRGSATDADGAAVAEAVIYAFPLGPKPVSVARTGTMDQINKEYVPLVVPVQVGATVVFPNKDNIRHHVYSFSAAKTFELKLYSGTPAKPVVFDKPGPVVLGCNIHDWMIGYIYVVDTPYFAKTDKSGSTRLDGLPPGNYQLHVWHPHMKTEPAPLPLKLTEGEDENASFRLELTPSQKVSPGTQ